MAVEEFLRQHDIPFEVRNPDENPLTPEELWKIMTFPDGRLRTPITVAGDQVILGFDPQKLARVFGLTESQR